MTQKIRRGFQWKVAQNRLNFFMLGESSYGDCAKNGSFHSVIMYEHRFAIQGIIQKVRS